MRFSFLTLIIGLLFLLAGCFESTPEAPKTPKAKPKLPTPEVVSVSPTDNGTTISLLPKIEVSFSLPMDSKLGKELPTDGSCTGVVQLSPDGFQTCALLIRTGNSDQQKSFQFLPTEPLRRKVRYQLRITPEAKSKKGAPLKSVYTTEDRFPTKWTISIGASGDDLGLALHTDAQGRLLVAGASRFENDDNVSEDGFLALYDREGDQQWIQQPGFGKLPNALALQPTDSGWRVGALLPGASGTTLALTSFGEDGAAGPPVEFSWPSAPQGSALVLDPAGNLLSSGDTRRHLRVNHRRWKQRSSATLGSGIFVKALALHKRATLYAGGIVTGPLDGTPSTHTQDGFVMKLDPSGLKRWSRRLPTAFSDAVTALAANADGVVVAGVTGGKLRANVSSLAEALESGQGDDAFVVRFDAQGNPQWFQQLGTEADERVHAIALSDNETLAIGGSTQGVFPEQQTAAQGDAFVSLLQMDGTLLWTRQFGTSGADEVRALAFLPNGNLVATGSVGGSLDGHTHQGGLDVFVVQFDAEGKRL